MKDSTTEATRASLDKMIEGDLGHATEMLSALWEIANENNDTETPSNALPGASDQRDTIALTSHDQQESQDTVPGRGPKNKKKGRRAINAAQPKKGGGTKASSNVSRAVSPSRYYLPVAW